MCAIVARFTLVLARPASDDSSSDENNNVTNSVTQEAKAFAAEIKSFITNLTSAQKQELGQIFRNTSATKAQLTAEYSAFANTLPPTQKQEAEDLFSKVEDFRQQQLAKFDNLSLSSTAAEALTDLKNIADDNSLTLVEECESAQTVIQGLSDADRESLQIPSQKSVDCSKIGDFLFHGQH